jgi:hypothetical protein
MHCKRYNQKDMLIQNSNNSDLSYGSQLSHKTNSIPILNQIPLKIGNQFAKISSQ